eukprot:g5536.t1
MSGADGFLDEEEASALYNGIPSEDPRNETRSARLDAAFDGGDSLVQEDEGQLLSSYVFVPPEEMSGALSGSFQSPLSAPHGRATPPGAGSHEPDDAQRISNVSFSDLRSSGFLPPEEMAGLRGWASGMTSDYGLPSGFGGGGVNFLSLVDESDKQHSVWDHSSQNSPLSSHYVEKDAEGAPGSPKMGPPVASHFGAEGPAKSGFVRRPTELRPPTVWLDAGAPVVENAPEAFWTRNTGFRFTNYFAGTEVAREPPTPAALVLERLSRLPTVREIYFDVDPGRRDVYRGPVDAWGNPSGPGGELWMSDGSVYVGDFEDGRPQGSGLFESRAVRYEGEFHQGRFCGQGTILYKDEGGRVVSSYVGRFLDDKEHGDGTFYFANGDSYMGFFKNGAPVGEGIYSHGPGAAI